MRSARKARIRATPHPAAPQPAPARTSTSTGLRPAWYVADTTSTAQDRSLEELHELAAVVFGPAAVPDEHTAVAALRLAEACLNHADAVANDGDSTLPPDQLGELLTGLNLTQSQIVQCAEHLARKARHQLHSGRRGNVAEKTELLVDMLLQAGDRGQLAAAHLNEARLLLDAG